MLMEVGTDHVMSDVLTLQLPPSLFKGLGLNGEQSDTHTQPIPEYTGSPILNILGHPS